MTRRGLRRRAHCAGPGPGGKSRGRPVNVRADDGQVGGAEVLPLGFAVFAVGTLLIANGWAVIDAKAVAEAAARETARTFAESPPSLAPAQSWELARSRGIGVFVSAGKDPDAAEVVVVGGAPSVQRCARIVVEARYEVPALTLPFISDVGRGYTVRARHTAIVDPFRSGLRGDGCG